MATVFPTQNDAQNPETRIHQRRKPLDPHSLFQPKPGYTFLKPEVAFLIDQVFENDPKDTVCTVLIGEKLGKRAIAFLRAPKSRKILNIFLPFSWAIASILLILTFSGFIRSPDFPTLNSSMTQVNSTTESRLLYTQFGVWTREKDFAPHKHELTRSLSNSNFVGLPSYFVYIGVMQFPLPIVLLLFSNKHILWKLFQTFDFWFVLINSMITAISICFNFCLDKRSMIAIMAPLGFWFAITTDSLPKKSTKSSSFYILSLLNSVSLIIGIIGIEMRWHGNSLCLYTIKMGSYYWNTRDAFFSSALSLSFFIFRMLLTRIFRQESCVILKARLFRITRPEMATISNDCMINFTTEPENEDESTRLQSRTILVKEGQGSLTEMDLSSPTTRDNFDSYSKMLNKSKLSRVHSNTSSEELSRAQYTDASIHRWIEFKTEKDGYLINLNKRLLYSLFRDEYLQILYIKFARYWSKPLTLCIAFVISPLVSVIFLGFSIHPVICYLIYGSCLILTIHTFLMSNSFTFRQLFYMFEFLYLNFIALVFMIALSDVLCWDHRSYAFHTVIMSFMLFLTIDTRSSRLVPITLISGFSFCLLVFIFLLSLHMGWFQSQNLCTTQWTSGFSLQSGFWSNDMNYAWINNSSKFEFGEGRRMKSALFNIILSSHGADIPPFSFDTLSLSGSCAIVLLLFMVKLFVLLLFHKSGVKGCVLLKVRVQKLERRVNSADGEEYDAIETR